MNETGRIRLLLVASHPVQYIAPLLRRLAARPDVDLEVVYCSRQGAESGLDPEFGVDVSWDLPLLDGYRWSIAPNRSPRPGLGRFGGLLNPSIWGTIRNGRFDVVLVAGYSYASYWIAMAAARASGAALVLSSDGTTIAPRDNAGWKKRVKPAVVPRIFRAADVVCVPSTAALAHVRGLGVDPARVVLAPYAVDNGAFATAASVVDVAAERAALGIAPDAPVALFCAKLQPWKRPAEALRAFAMADVPGSHLLVAGDGPERTSLEGLARDLGVADRVHFLGFVNQSRLPAVYAMSDVLVLPSEFEPWGLVVNEAMACSRPAIVSDAVGARADLITQGETGFSYPVGDVEALASLFGKLLCDRPTLAALGRNASRRMATWSYDEQIAGFVAASKLAIASRGKRRPGP